MRTRTAVSLALAAGFGLGAIAIEGLHAQAKPPIYYIAEIDVHNADGYMNDYAPKAQAVIRKSGGRILAASNSPRSIEGQPPKGRVVVQQWDSIEQIMAYRNSEEFKQVRQIGNKYATFRAFALEGMPQQ
jgi:uncharacterized protein (DUF1330 family)